jgi:hypothetical protein
MLNRRSRLLPSFKPSNHPPLIIVVVCLVGDRISSSHAGTKFFMRRAFEQGAGSHRPASALKDGILEPRIVEILSLAMSISLEVCTKGPRIE